MKLIIFVFSSLLILNGVSNGMEIVDDNVASTEKVLFNLDLMPQVIEQVWKNRHYNTLYVERSIRSFSCTNKFFYHYYSAENNQQTITRNIARHNYESDESAAILLHFDAISQKIKYFIDIASNKDRQFTQEDFREKWYLNATNVCNKPLAYIAIQHDNLAVAQLIIHHLGLDLTCKEMSRLAEVLYWKICRTEDAGLLNQLQTFHSGLKKELLIRHHQ
jgi:hypothetical protein